MRVCLDHFDNIERHIKDIETVVLGLVQPYLPQIEIILSLPSIKDIFTAIAIIGEIGVDMSVFHSSKHLCSWAGLTPQNNESAGKKKSVRVSRAGVYIKPLLVQCANAAIKSKKCTYFKVRYDQIKSCHFIIVSINRTILLKYTTIPTIRYKFDGCIFWNFSFSCFIHFIKYIQSIYQGLISLISRFKYQMF
ncbi:Transposase IS116/IS110/IS902 family protein [Clostridium formicaceticum]|uniref:Transposase IS116/IS110/IS902 family protein n=2 Tax=Clostridium formicaceticum TaxID=1497 RepID=A0AAC9RIG0_9CLOT|nr:IS110 family transposase [Clostridium formicaceticum]ARE87666.1 Transposase IS116/IS110/IS902 family protein [Clostridium formicaceticum]